MMRVEVGNRKTKIPGGKSRKKKTQDGKAQDCFSKGQRRLQVRDQIENLEDFTAVCNSGNQTPSSISCTTAMLLMNAFDAEQMVYLLTGKTRDTGRIFNLGW